MAIFNLFSKRQQALRKTPSDILVYDNIPHPLRAQIVHVISDALGTQHSHLYGNPIEDVYQKLHDALCREYGIFQLNSYRTYQERVLNFILDEKDIEKVLDTVEISLSFIDKVIRNDFNYYSKVVVKLKPDEAIDELNERFKQHAIGYQYQSGDIIKVDSTFIHSEIVKPTLVLLNYKAFRGANEEYLKAHEHYRHGRNKECLADCLKAFESTMKIIIKAKAWTVDDKATSSGLIKVCFDNGLIPLYLQTQITSLRSALESGIPTIRNRIGGHGQGASQTVADDYTTRFTLNLTGSCIIYLIELSGI